MQNRVGRLVAAMRRARGLSPQRLAAAIGYRNVERGARHVVTLERDGIVVAGFLERVVATLGLDPAEVARLRADDRRDHRDAWERWVNDPVVPELRFRPFAALWCGARLPPGISRAGAIAYAERRAGDTGLVHVLVWSRRERVWCRPGEPAQVEPVRTTIRC